MTSPRKRFASWTVRSSSPRVTTPSSVARRSDQSAKGVRDIVSTSSRQTGQTPPAAMIRNGQGKRQRYRSYRYCCSHETGVSLRDDKPANHPRGFVAGDGAVVLVLTRRRVDRHRGSRPRLDLAGVDVEYVDVERMAGNPLIDELDGYVGVGGNRELRRLKADVEEIDRGCRSDRDRGGR